MQKVTDNIYILILIAMAGTAVLVVFFILLQMRNQNRILRQKRTIQEAEIAHQKELLLSVITSQEAERKRIGMDLHDEVGAALSTLRIKIERHAALDNATGEFSADCKADIDRIVTNMRNISHSLSPRIAGSFGFYDAISELSDQVNRTGKLNMLLDFDEHMLPVFTNEQTAMALYRVLAELVNNTLKHAHAKNICLSIVIAAGKMEIAYTDDGNGVAAGKEATANGMGLQNIESRLGIIGAAWQVKAPESGGYGMFISVPVK